MQNGNGAPVPQEKHGPGSAKSDRLGSAKRLDLGPGDVVVGCRSILPGDEHSLRVEECVGLSGSVDKVRRQRGAARSLARHLLTDLGYGEATIPRGGGGLPLWPPGIVGSLAHDDAVTVAAVSKAEKYYSIGIDVEPADPLPNGLIELVSTPRERKQYPLVILESRLLFVVKEAIYKATYAIDHTFLEFVDVEADLASGTGTTRSGHHVRFTFTSHQHIVALAYILR